MWETSEGHPHINSDSEFAIIWSPIGYLGEIWIWQYSTIGHNLKFWIPEKSVIKFPPWCFFYFLFNLLYLFIVVTSMVNKSGPNLPFFFLFEFFWGTKSSKRNKLDLQVMKMWVISFCFHLSLSLSFSLSCVYLFSPKLSYSLPLSLSLSLSLALSNSLV